MKENNIEQSIIKTLRESDLSIISRNTGEYILDFMLKEPAIKSIPVFSTLQNLYNVGISIRDHIFLKKICNFLFCFKDTTCEERQKLIAKLESDDSYGKKAGEQITLLLDRLDDMAKPELVAKAFKAYLREHINGDQLQRFNFTIDRVYIYNLELLKEYYLKYLPDNVVHAFLDPMIFQNLADAGLLNLTTGYSSGVGTQKNELGLLFVRHIL